MGAEADHVDVAVVVHVDQGLRRPLQELPVVVAAVASDTDLADVV